MKFEDYRQARESVLADTAAALRLAVAAVDEQRKVCLVERERDAVPYVEWAGYESAAREAKRVLQGLIREFETL